jgi:hypothetical protein
VDSSAQFQAQLRHFDAGLGETTTLATAAGKQAIASEKGAVAAKSAADTAKDALHVSERAYVSIGQGEFDSNKKLMTIAIVNTGHIPSGDVKMTGFSMLLSAEGEKRGGFIIACHKMADALGSVAPGTRGISYNFTFPQGSKDLMLAGQQRIVIAGDILYSDGFHDTPIRHWPLCYESTYHTDLKQIILLPCDGSQYLPDMEKEPRCQQN